MILFLLKRERELTLNLILQTFQTFQRPTSLTFTVLDRYVQVHSLTTKVKDVIDGHFVAKSSLTSIVEKTSYSDKGNTIKEFIKKHQIN